ncbi:MAG TPA: ribbon-helix-helix domain-containing protein [Micromonosporaceae bacterium]|nr:ribbon-helix-helix domain-containing protein [Micromonosporaceae bacterium]
MTGREYGWTDAGKASAARHGVTERETVEALYSPRRIDNQVGTLLLAVAGLADTARSSCCASGRQGQQLCNPGRPPGDARGDQAIDGGHSMTVHRDPRMMSRDELVAYFDSGGDISELLRDATVGPYLGPTPSPETVPMIVTGVRLPSATVQRLDELAGNDKGGRSGLIRRAIDEFLQRHASEAA